MNKIAITFTDGNIVVDREMTKDEITLILETKPVIESDGGDKIYKIKSFHFNLGWGTFTVVIEEEPNHDEG